MSLQTRILIYLIVLSLFDTIIPIPITAMAMIYILFQKPAWFKQWVRDIYRA